jgi:flagellar hook-length control protein FliK
VIANVLAEPAEAIETGEPVGDRVPADAQPVRGKDARTGQSVILPAKDGTPIVEGAPVTSFLAGGHQHDGRSNGDAVPQQGRVAFTKAGARLETAVPHPITTSSLPLPFVIARSAGGGLDAVSPLLTETAMSPSAGSLSHLVQSIRLQWARGGGDAVIRLEPGHFGEVRIAVRVESGQVAARLQVEAPAAREWLQNNQIWLRQSLSEHGLTLERLEVSESSEAPGREREPADRDGSRDAPTPRKPRRPATGARFDTFV